jgi:hypothetical protein
MSYGIRELTSACVYIPREAFDKQAVEKGQVRFYDVAYLQVKPHIKGTSVKIELTNFTTYYTKTICKSWSTR